MRPMTPFMGVRISWLIVATNADFAREASSATSRASSSSRWAVRSERISLVIRTMASAMTRAVPTRSSSGSAGWPMRSVHGLEHRWHQQRDDGQHQLGDVPTAGVLCARADRHRRRRWPPGRVRHQGCGEHVDGVRGRLDGGRRLEDQIGGVGEQPAGDADPEPHVDRGAGLGSHEHPYDEREQHRVGHRVARPHGAHERRHASCPRRWRRPRSSRRTAGRRSRWSGRRAPSRSPPAPGRGSARAPPTGPDRGTRSWRTRGGRLSRRSAPSRTRRWRTRRRRRARTR